MNQNDFTLAALAEIGAIRHLLVQAVALRLLDEGDPLHTLAMLDRQLTAAQTQPTELGAGLDPAISDHLASLTDDRVRALLDDVSRRLAGILTPQAAL